MPGLRALAALGLIVLFGGAASHSAWADQNDPFYGQNTRFSWSGQLTQGGFILGLAPDGAVAVVVGDVPVELGPDGTFFAAFDRDAPATVQLTARLDSGQLHGETIAITPRQWQIEHLNVAKRASGSDEAYWKIREPEYNAINAARAQRTGAGGWRQDFIWPVKGRISGRFGRQRIYRGEPADYHSGIDIAPGNGVPFVTPADGTVVLARTGFSLEGGLIIIDHGSGLNSAFLHASKIVVREGERVMQGQHIGNVGATGRATGPHLHWSLKWNDARLDPLLFTGPMD
jgi:murein DD-endopeptidase MepM/ murein hydrolase activator NlpD